MIKTSFMYDERKEMLQKLFFEENGLTCDIAPQLYASWLEDKYVHTPFMCIVNGNDWFNIGFESETIIANLNKLGFKIQIEFKLQTKIKIINKVFSEIFNQLRNIKVSKYPEIELILKEFELMPIGIIEKIKQNSNNFEMEND